MRLIIFIAVFINFVYTIRTKAQCPRHELYFNSTLSPACDVNCQDLRRLCPLTVQHAQAGCYCQPNYARNLRQQCVPTSECSQDCFPNEVPIPRWRRGCEYSCRVSPTVVRVTLCYGRHERRCVCSMSHCRNRNGQCQRGS